MVNLHVLYDPGTAFGYWTVNLPNDWHWVGQTLSGPIQDNYQFEEQYSGRQTSKQAVRAHLNSFFEDLMHQNIIARFTIVDSLDTFPDPDNEDDDE